MVSSFSSDKPMNGLETGDIYLVSPLNYLIRHLCFKLANNKELSKSIN